MGEHQIDHEIDRISIFLCHGYRAPQVKIQEYPLLLYRAH